MLKVTFTTYIDGDSSNVKELAHKLRYLTNILYEDMKIPSWSLGTEYGVIQSEVPMVKCSWCGYPICEAKTMDDLCEPIVCSEQCKEAKKEAPEGAVWAGSTDSASRQNIEV